MAKKKTFKEKEQAFLAKNGKNTSQEEFKAYVPEKSQRDKALEALEARGFKVSVRDSVLYCECKSEAEYERYCEMLISNFGKDGKVPFSYGASVGKEEAR